MQGINSRLDNTEDQISELEYRVVRISQAELKKGKRNFKNEASLRDLWDSIKHTNICIIRVPQGGERERKGQRLYWKKMYNLKDYNSHSGTP